MSWLDFFRKREKIETEKKEKIDFSILGSKIESELEFIRKKRKEMNNEIKNLLDNFIAKIKNHIETLKSINIDEKKEDERIKFIVKENLGGYIEHLNRLIGNLEGLSSEEYTKISLVIENFMVTSIHSFEKVTILIGKEMDSVKKDLKKFSDEFNSILYNNKSLFDKEKDLKNLRNIFEELEKRKKFEIEIKNSVGNLEKNKETIKRKKMDAEKNLNDIKNNSKYKNALAKKEEEKEKFRKNEEELFKIKQEIDLKFLAKYFHGIKKKEHIISELNRDFTSSLRNNEDSLINLLKEAKPEFDIDKIRKAMKERERLKNEKESEIIWEIKKIEEELKKSVIEELRIEDLIKNEKNKLEKIQEKINEKKIEIGSQANLIWKSVTISFD